MREHRQVGADSRRAGACRQRSSFDQAVRLCRELKLRVCHSLARDRSQVLIQFEGSASSQELNGSYAVVPCGEAFSEASAATLGVGCQTQFTSSSILTVK